MATQRHLQNAPITEAIIDLRVKARKDLKPETFAQLIPVMAAEFPIVEERRKFETVFQLYPSAELGDPPVAHRELLGYFFKSADQRTIAQFRVDGFTLNRLHPYPSWEELRPNALRLWSLYVDIARPVAVSRIALRYINRLDVPSQADLDDYLTAGPVIPEKLPQYVGRFLTRVTIQDPQSGLQANIGQALDGTAGGPTATVLLDIDAFRLVDFEPRGGAIEKTLAALHEFKNRIFFSSITEKAASIYE